MITAPPTVYRSGSALGSSVRVDRFHLEYNDAGRFRRGAEADAAKRRRGRCDRRPDGMLSPGSHRLSLHELCDPAQCVSGDRTVLMEVVPRHHALTPSKGYIENWMLAFG
jgi:hypothetical protein